MYCTLCRMMSQAESSGATVQYTIIQAYAERSRIPRVEMVR